MPVFANVLIAFLVGSVVLVLFVAWRAKRCGTGWQVWFLSVVAKLYVGLMIRWESNKPCPFPKNGPAIIVGNHTSPVDPVLVWYRHNAGWDEPKVRTIGFLVASEYVERKSVVGWVCRTMQSIPVKRAGRDMAGVRKALARLKADKWLGIFPEGGINRTPEDGLNDFNTGVAFLSLKSGVPVYPVFIQDAPRAKTMAACFFVRSKTRIVYGEPIDLSTQFGGKKLTADVLAEATAQVRNAIEQLGAGATARNSCRPHSS